MKKEYLLASLIASLVILFANAPIVYYSVVGKAGLTFLGRRVVNSQDAYTYVSFIEQSRQGAWAFENLFTTEPQKPNIIRPTYLLIGKMARSVHISSLAAYQVSRIAASLLFCFVLYLFVRELFSRPKQRLAVFLLVLTASGLGWLLGRFINYSSDLWIPESNVFMSMAESPHFILSQALMLTAFYSYLRFLNSKKKHVVVVTFICCAVLAFDHPFDLMIIGPVLFFTGLFAQAPLLPTLIISFFATIGILYPLYELKMNPVFASEQAQGVSYSPSPMSYLSGFGILVPFSFLGANRLINERRVGVKLVLVWAAIGALLLYAPVSFQRRLSEGLSIPISILAASASFQLYGHLKNHRKKLAVPIFALLLAVFMLSSIRLIKNDFETIGKDSSDHYYYYVSNEEYAGLSWFFLHTTSKDVVLANWFYGNLLPGVAARRVYVGHKAQTIKFDEKIENINSFLLEKDESTAKKFLQDNQISYIFLGNNDTMLQYGFKPEEKKYLEKVWEQGGARIYKVASSK